MMRKPSCLISYTQPAPAGGFSAGRGRHGSMKPARRRVGARNNVAVDNSAGAGSGDRDAEPDASARPVPPASTTNASASIN
jgi:hypothetical protein